MTKQPAYTSNPKHEHCSLLKIPTNAIMLLNSTQNVHYSMPYYVLLHVHKH